MVALCSDDSITSVAAEIKGAGGAVIVTSKTTDGVKIEPCWTNITSRHDQGAYLLAPQSLRNVPFFGGIDYH